MSGRSLPTSSLTCPLVSGEIRSTEAILAGAPRAEALLAARPEDVSFSALPLGRTASYPRDFRLARPLLNGETMKTSMVQRLFSALVVGSALLCAVEPADAKEAAAIVEVAAPPPDFNTSTVALRTAAESELEHGSLPRGHRRVVISLALKQTGAAPIACSVNATVRDAKTGAMIAVVETATRATGPLSPALRKELADAAVRSAVRRVPGAIRAQK